MGYSSRRFLTSCRGSSNIISHLVATDLLHAQNLNEWLTPKGFAVVRPETFESSEFHRVTGLLQNCRCQDFVGPSPICCAHLSVHYTISVCRPHLLSYLVSGVHGAASAQVILTQQLFLTNEPCCDGQLQGTFFTSCKLYQDVSFPSYILTTLESSPGVSSDRFWMLFRLPKVIFAHGGMLGKEVIAGHWS